MANSIDPDQLASEEDLEIYCLGRVHPGSAGTGLMVMFVVFE